MVKAKLTLLEVQVERRFSHTVKFQQAALGTGPKGLCAIDVVTAMGEFIGTMLHTVMFLVSEIYEAIIAPPAIGMDNPVRVSTLPRMMPCSVALAQSGTISV